MTDEDRKSMELDGLRASRIVQAKRIKTLEDDKARLMEQVSELSNSNEVLIEVRQKQEDVIESVTAKRDGYANTIKSQDAEIERLTTVNESLTKANKDLNAANLKHARTASELREENERLSKERFETEQTELGALRREIGQRNQQVETAQRRIAELEETDRHKTKRIQGDAKEIDRLRQNVAFESDQRKKADDANWGSLYRENQGLKKTVDEQGCAIAKLREENEHLRSISDTRRKGLESLDQEAEDLGKTCGRLRVENEKLSEQNSDLVKTEANLRRQNMEMGQRIHDLNGKNLQEVARRNAEVHRLEQEIAKRDDLLDAYRSGVVTKDCKAETPRSFETATDIAGPLKPIPFDHHLANKVIMAMPERVAFPQMEAKLDGTIHLILHGEVQGLMARLHPAVHGIMREMLTEYGIWLSDQQAHPVLSHKAAQDYACQYLKAVETPEGQENTDLRQKLAETEQKLKDCKRQLYRYKVQI